MNEYDFIAYFNDLSDRFHTTGTPDRLQGGIGIIRAPHKYGVMTLAYWYNECKKAGY